MSKYTCSDCNKVFDKKDSYNKHLNRKIPCSNDKLNLYEVIQNLERKVNHIDTMSRITNDKELTDLWENLHHLLWSSEGFTPEKAMDHLMFIFYIRLLEPRIKDGSIKLSDSCKFSALARITDPNMLWEKFTSQTLPELAEHSREYFSQFGIRRAENLYKLIGHINRIDLEHTDRDFLGHIFEYIIGRGTSSMSDDGQYFTNRPICRYAMELVNPQIHKKNVPTMIDPFCGTGGFITEFVKYLSKQGTLNWEKQKDKIFGIDIKIGSILTTLINLMFCTGVSFDPEKIVHKNSFYDTLFGRQKFNFIFTNPPFGGDKDKGEQFRFKYAEYEKKVNKDTGKNTKGRKRIRTLVSPEIESIGIEVDDKVDCAVMLCMAILAEAGIACLVLPEGFFFGKDKRRTELRKKLIEEYNVKYIVDIPQDAFENTSTKTSMIVFQKGEKTSEIEFIDFLKRDGERTITKASLNELRSKGYSLSYNTYIKHEWALSEGYKLVRLGDICEINPESYTNKDALSEIKYVDLSSVTNMKIAYTTLLKVGYDEIPSRAKRKVKIGDVLIGTVRPNLRNHCLVDKSVWSDNMIVSTGFCVLRPKENKVLSSYLFYQICQDRVTDIFSSKATGTSYPAINSDIIKDLQIPLPSLEHQQEWVSKIDLYRDLAIHAQKTVELMELTAISEVKGSLRHPEAKMTRLGDICEIISGKALPKKNSVDGIYKVVGGGISSYTHDTYNREGSDFVITRVGTPMIQWMNEPYYLSENGFAVDIINNSCLKSYLYFILVSNFSLVEKTYNRTAQPITNKGKLSDLEIPLPPLRVQTKLKPLFDHIASLKSSIKDWTVKVDMLICQLGEEAQGICAKNNEDNKAEEYCQIVIEDEEKSEDEIVVIEESKDEAIDCETLKKKNMKEIQSIAKEQNISGRSKMKKQDLIDAILSSKKTV